MPEQRPPLEGDFAFLPDRERHIAGYIDALPDGAVMDVKSLAKVLPLYGQTAVGSALRALSVAGHLRRVRGLNGEGNQVRWVTRTYWSRIAHDNEWWNAFLVAETTPAPVPAPVPVPVSVSVPEQRAEEPRPETELVPVPGVGSGEERQPSKAFVALARLGRVDERLALSAVECAELEPLAAEWFERGVDATYLRGALTAGLPESVRSPFGLVRRRLRDKLPPRLPVVPRIEAEVPMFRAMAVCTECETPGRPEAFRDGLCKPCRQPEPEPESEPAARPLSPGFNG
ncbi:MarR family transcriptional regulator [Streptomyces sp. sk2.1]|uniref:MarR family transcriptional regulator n=1 Tax=Streptomyces sp. sk2.1 TaxID=2478959 RepID=UPI00165305A7|nr:MarR family transcriptional regulator [Streptomyces sp. sk2.1]